MLSIYMLGSMTGLDFDTANAPREQFANKVKQHGFRTINPCLGWNFDNFYDYSPKEVVQSNDMFLDQSDIGVLFNTPPLNVMTSPGSLYEVYYYKWHPEKPLFSIGNYTEYRPHIMESVTRWFNTDDELIDYLVTIYGQLL